MSSNNDLRGSMVVCIVTPCFLQLSKKTLHLAKFGRMQRFPVWEMVGDRVLILIWGVH